MCKSEFLVVRGSYFDCDLYKSYYDTNCLIFIVFCAVCSRLYLVSSYVIGIGLVRCCLYDEVDLTALESL